MLQAGVTIKGTRKVSRWLEAKKAESEKAMNTALRVEGFRLKNLMQREIRAGAPGGRPFAPLTYIARRARSDKRPGRSPLEALSKGVRYEVSPRPPYNAVAVGFVGPMTWSDADLALGYVGRRANQYSPGLSRNPALNPLGRGITRSNISSKRWRALAEQQQKGFTRTITDKQREWLARRGASLLGWRRSLAGDTSYTGTYGRNLEAVEGNSPFFLRKSTTRFVSPPRPIIAPFWAAHAAQARRNIERNFVQKMKGQRI